MPLRTSASSAVSSFDLGRVRRESFTADVEFHAELESTNNRAVSLAAQSDIATPLLVWAEHQTFGRGRGNNSWWSAPGSLTFSLLFDATTIGVPIDRWPEVSLVAALAIRQTIADLLPGEEVQVKWPNDVFLRGRKVSGILVEIPPLRPEKLVVGIGVNVNNSFAAAPAALRSIATSLIDALEPAQGDEIANCKMQIANCKMEDEPFDSVAPSTQFAICNSSVYDPTDVLIRLLKALSQELARLQHGPRDLAARWRPHCFLHGRTVHVAAGATNYVGLCQGIDDTGALVLVNESGLQRFISGVVTCTGPFRHA